MFSVYREGVKERKSLQRANGAGLCRRHRVSGVGGLFAVPGTAMPRVLGREQAGS